MRRGRPVSLGHRLIEVARNVEAQDGVVHLLWLIEAIDLDHAFSILPTPITLRVECGELAPLVRATDRGLTCLSCVAIEEVDE